MFRKSIQLLFVFSFLLLILSACSKDNPVESVIPEAPTNLMGEALGAYTISLNWDDNSDNEDGFALYRSVGAPFERVAELDANATSYVDVIEVSCVEAHYYLAAKNSSGESMYSNSITVPLLCSP